MHQDAVDAPKNTNDSKLEYATFQREILHVLKEKPDFMSQDNWTYRSDSVLGKIYRLVDLEFLQEHTALKLFHHDCYLYRLKEDEKQFYFLLANEMLAK